MSDEKIQNKKLRLILLEDMDSDAELIQYYLKKGNINFEANHIQTQKAFKKALANYNPDIILSDYSLPSFDGISALKMVQKDYPNIPFIFVTGAMGEEWAIETLKSGATDYVLKDKLSRLAPAVKRALQEVKERQQRIEAEEALIKNKKELEIANCILKRKNTEIKEINEHLEYLVGQQTKELKNAISKLAEKNILLDQKNQQLLGELKMAKRVQQNIILNENRFPKGKDFIVSAKYMSLESVGGDLYDVIQLDDDIYGFLIADVSGHGVPSALISTMVKVSFFANTNKMISPAETCQRVNQEMYKFIGDLEYFITAYYGILNLKTGIFKYANAGHPPAIFYRKETESIKQLTSYGCCIGAFNFNEMNFDKGEIKLIKGDRILFYTDGIVEAKNLDRKIYGKNRLLNYIIQNSCLSTEDFVNGLILDIQNFCQGYPTDDDRAILYFEYLGNH